MPIYGLLFLINNKTIAYKKKAGDFIKVKCSIILLFVVCVLFAGCNNNSAISTTDNKSGQIKEAKSDEPDIPEVSASDSLYADSTEYQQFLKKIWVVDDWGLDTYLRSISFRFTKIENGIVEGQLTAQSVAEPNIYVNQLDYENYEDNFFGVLNDNIAECFFDSKIGNSGTIVMEFKESDRIDAFIEYMSKGEFNKDLLDGNYIFRPYNITDLDGFIVDEERSFEVNLDSWGDVRFVSGYYNGIKPFPEGYLTNLDNDILYRFGAPYQTATEIYDVTIADINGDGLKDVTIITYLPYAPEAIFEWIFYQMENGWFYRAS